MTTVVTGGAGFIGSHLCEALLDEGRSVVCLDNLGSGRHENVTQFEDRTEFTFLRGDVRNDVIPQLERVGVSPPDVRRIYHLASRASPVDFDDYPMEILETNGFGTRNVLEFAADVGASVVYASTSEVYGNPDVHPQPLDYNGNVNFRGERACYDESKRFGETLCSLYEGKRDVDVRTVRIFNTYGPRMRPDDGRVVPTFVRQALDGADLTVYGDGTQTRSFMYIDDLIRGLRRMMDRSGLAGEVVNLGHTNEITINRLAEVVADLVDRNIDVVHEALPEDDPQRRQPDLSHTRELLDWNPTTSLETGLDRTIAHFHEAEVDA
ncbi:NAD-dependent epimerase/dehydratase family protein [Salinirarus marinus]|uniref:NAD-dependent epimerase/dehydratase family protein n=1 Tax=Salinirarus marinus TaxID=3068310 RepID=UPI003C6C6AF3